MIVKSFEGGFDKNFSYLLWCKESKIAGIIDPSVDITPIVETIEEKNLQLSKILITHTHYDHISYLDSFVHLFPNIKIFCHDKYIKKFCEYIDITIDEFWSTTEKFRGEMWQKDENCTWKNKIWELFKEV